MNSILDKLKSFPAWVQGRLSQLRLPVPRVQLDRALLIPIGLVLLFALANIGLFIGIISPGIESRVVLAAQVEQERTNLLNARRLREESPDSLQRRITQAQALLDRAPKLFLAENQVNGIVSSIYENAALSGIALTDLSVQANTPGNAAVPISSTVIAPTVTVAKPTINPRKVTTTTTTITTTTTAKTPLVPTRTATPKATPAAAANPAITLYRQTVLHLQAQGTSQRLVNFLARLAETGVPGVVVNTLTITGKDQLATLTLDLALYSSSAADRTAPTTMTLANGTPQVLPTPTPTNPLDAFPVIVSNAVSLPQAQATPTAQRFRVYAVQNGDTIFAVAQRFGVPAQAIVNANAMTNLNLSLGQRLLIPAP